VITSNEDESARISDLIQAIDMRSEQRHLLDARVAKVFGQHSIELSANAEPIGVRPATGRHWCISPVALRQGLDAFASPSALPFANEELDLVVVDHLLNIADDPHDVFRECARVVAIGGTMIIISINPISLHWLRLAALRMSGKKINLGMQSAARIADWFRLLGFRVTDTLYGSLWPQCQVPYTKELSAKAGSLGVGQYYIMIAKKTHFSGEPDTKLKARMLKGFGSPMVGPAINREST